VDIAVINLMRLGDLVQTTPVLRCLRTQYPGGRVTLVAKDLFQETARLLPWLDRVVLFPSITLATRLGQEEGWPEAVQALREWLRETFPHPPDLVINLTPNLLGGILAYATGAREIRGMAVDQTWELGTRPAWASYALIVSKARQANPFNLVDLFLREAGLAPDGRGVEVTVPREAEVEADNLIKNLGLPANTALIGLFPGASRPERCWPADRFAQTAHLLLERRPCHFLIFGSGREAPLGEAISRQVPVSAASYFFGRTTPAGLAACLKRLDLLITNDTGPMHLAAAVGTRTVALFLASARVQDTGPTGRGHVILEPRLDCHPCLFPCPQPRCHQVITPEAVVHWAALLLDKGNLKPVDEVEVHRLIRAYVSTIDPLGYHAYLPLVRRPLSCRDFWLWMHRRLWGQILDGSTFSSATLTDWLNDVLGSYYLPPLDDPGFATGELGFLHLCQIASRGEQLAEEIMQWASKCQQFPVRVWQKMEALGAVDQDLRRIGVSFPELSALMEFFFQEQRAKHGGEITPLAQELQMAYALLRHSGELALERLANLKMILNPPGRSGEYMEMAQTMQPLFAKKGALSRESEELSCR